jgi:putative component of membrane protein insertase Oxa1/YidC/SpoIIIJ protein YidD
MPVPQEVLLLPSCSFHSQCIEYTRRALSVASTSTLQSHRARRLLPATAHQVRGGFTPRRQVQGPYASSTRILGGRTTAFPLLSVPASLVCEQEQG